MYYQTTIFTSSNTLAAVPLVTTLQLARGQITKLLVAFPPGPVGLLHVIIKDKGWQIAPWSLGQDLAGDDYAYEMTTQYPLIVEPYELTVITWNEDDSYAHQVTIGVELEEGDPSAGGALLQYPLQEG